MEQRYELRMVELALQRDLTTAQFEVEQERVRRELTLQQGLEVQRWEHEMKLRQQRAALARSEQELDDIARRERDLKDEQQRLEIARQRAQTQADIAAAEREQERLDAELGLTIMDQMKAKKLARQREEQLNELERQQREIEIKMQAEERRIRLQMEQERHQAGLELEKQKQQQEFELKRIEQMSTLSVEAIVSLSNAEQGRIIADLQRTEALKGMDSESILALAAEKSPQVAQAFAEKFKGLAEGTVGERERKLYEQLLAQKDETAAATLRTMEESARRESETARHAMDTTADVAKEFARGGGQQPPIIVTPGGGVGGTVAGGPVGSTQATGGEVVVCPNCQYRSEVGTQFCANCGHRFFDR